MTSRLKHKLELENINLKSAYLNESFVLIGTPLPDLSSTKKDKLEYVPEWQQEVRDEQGRRRFHGAFTGGFSAGYFNSVGSKEGWAPTEFKSSRGNRATKTQRAEDFMDEEDLQQMKEDRKLENTATFQPIQQKQDAFESLIRPNQSSIGEVLLSKLGWRRGQGIGPRISLRQVRRKQGKKLDEDDPAREHTFPPPDVKLVVYHAKEDHHGLGYFRSYNFLGDVSGQDEVLNGFALDPAGVPRDKWFAMPEVPNDWRPRPARVWGTTRKWDGELDLVKEVIPGQPLQPLSHEQRGAALGEPLTSIDVPCLSPRTASAALQGFIPYGDDLIKQDRYKSYLSSQTHNTKTPVPKLRIGSIEEINKELSDFAASARIFKPMSFAMSNRFTSGSASLATTDLNQPKPGLLLFAPIAPAIEQPVEAQPKSAREHAAVTDNHGVATRTVGVFYPEKLLCKRFGVPNPRPDGEPKVDVAMQEDVWSEVTQGPSREKGDSRPTSLAEVGMADDSEQGRDTLSYVKPGIDIFKAIFESDEVEGVRDLDELVDLNGQANEEAEDIPEAESEGPVDLNTFKPVFRPRKDLSGEKKKKDKKRKGVLSFDHEEEERKRPKGDRSLAADFM